MAIAIAVSFTGPAQAQTTSASPFQIVEASIDDIHTAFRSGRLTARQLVQGYLDRINAYDRQGPNINSVITINPDALAEADRLDAAFRTSGLAGPLHGIAILVKDERLLSLAIPVQRAAEHCPWLKAMVNAGAIFHPLRWSPQQAVQFLRDVPALESAACSCACRQAGA